MPIPTEPVEWFAMFLPVIALIPAAVFWLCYRRMHRLSFLIGACVWVLYALYEVYMSWKWNPPGVPLRVDVFLLWPALIAISVFLILWVITRVLLEKYFGK